MNSEFWDRRYSTDDFLYGELPNEFLAEMVTLLVPNGSVFVPGDGEGRKEFGWLAEGSMSPQWILLFKALKKRDRWHLGMV